MKKDRRVQVDKVAKSQTDVAQSLQSLQKSCLESDRESNDDQHANGQSFHITGN